MKIDESIIKKYLCLEHINKLTINNLLTNMKKEQGIQRCWACGNQGDIPYRDTFFFVCEKCRWMN